MKRLYLIGIIILISHSTLIAVLPLPAVNNMSGINADENIVTLVASGTGLTKENATKSALRSALEQAYGTFVSSNTQIVNDELVKDEIVSISSGNIRNYNEISCIELPQGGYDVSVKAVVSIGNLVTFAQNHGMSTELSGNTFLMNRNMAKLNRKNEKKALNDLLVKVCMLVVKGVYDYHISVGEPVGNNPYNVSVNISLTPNENMTSLWTLIDESLNSICMSEQECENYRKLSMSVWNYDNYYYLKKNFGFSGDLNRDKNKVFKFRDYYGDFIGRLEECLTGAKYSYEIYDNLGTVITPYLIEYESQAEYGKIAKNCIDEGSKAYDRFYSVSLVPIPSQNPNSQIDVLGRYWRKSAFDIVYTESRLSALKEISIRPHPILLQKNKDFEANRKLMEFKYHMLQCQTIEEEKGSNLDILDHLKKASIIISELEKTNLFTQEQIKSTREILNQKIVEYSK